jgi:hypothetical protein
MGILTPQVPLHVNGQEFVSAGGVTGNFWDGTANKNGVLDSFEADENFPTKIVYRNHCGVSIPEMERGRAVELWNYRIRR